MKKAFSFALLLFALGTSILIGNHVKAEDSSQQVELASDYFCRADINQDGVVNTADLLIFLGCYPCDNVAKACPSCASSDFNGDGVINWWDYWYIMSAINAGTTCP